MFTSIQFLYVTDDKIFLHHNAIMILKSIRTYTFKEFTVAYLHTMGL